MLIRQCDLFVPNAEAEEQVGTACAEAVGILNQLRVFAVSPQARSRLNTAFVTSNFIGGALGSAAAAVLWSAGGWTAVAITGVVLSIFALALWAIGRRGALVVEQH
jgi:hypothetical protein